MTARPWQDPATVRAVNAARHARRVADMIRRGYLPATATTTHDTTHTTTHTGDDNR